MSICRLLPWPSFGPDSTTNYLAWTRATETFRTGQSRLLNGYRRCEDPVGLVHGIETKLVDGDDLIGGIAIGVKALVAGHPGIVDALDGVDHRLPERLAPCRITGAGRRLSPIGQRRLDRLDDDVGAVIGRSTVDVDRICRKSRILLAEGRRSRILGGVYDGNRAIDWSARDPNGGGKGGSHDAIPTAKGGGFQSVNMRHLLADQQPTGGVNPTKVDHIRLQRRHLGE